MNRFNWFALVCALGTATWSSAQAQSPDASVKRPVPAERAPAASAFHAEVSVLHATNSKKGIDQRIGDMPELRKPPFSAYDSYELLGKTQLPLERDTAKTMQLPNGRVLKAALVEQLPHDFLRIKASINQPNGKDFLPLLEVKAKVGQHFIVAGQNYKSGILVLVIKIVK